MWPFVSERIMHACGQLKTIINRSRNFALDAENEKTVTHPRFSWRLTALNNTVGPYQFYWILTSKLTLIVLFYYFQVIPFWYFYLSRLPDHVITVTNTNRFSKDGDKHSANVFPIPSKYRQNTVHEPASWHEPIAWFLGRSQYLKPPRNEYY